MRKIAIILSFFILLSGCAVMPTAPEQKQGLHIVTSFYPIYILTKNITKGAEGVTVTNMTENHSGCPHNYVLLPQDMKTLENADIFIINGGGLETFMDKVMKQSHLTIIDASRHIELLDDNPHIWVSIKGAMEQILNITDSLCENNPQNAVVYKRNCYEFTQKLQAQYDKMKGALAPYEGQYIATFHEAFDYFAADFGLKISAVVEVEAGNEPTPGQLTSTIKTIKETNTKALFDEPHATSNAPNIISAQTGLSIYTLNPINEGDDDLDAYFTIMDENLQALLKGLQ